ncbi:MAG: hypothetical protein ACR2P0_07280 [Acidimicrobiales bacterium]
MTDGDRDSSGELTTFLHLTGWRPLLLVIIAGFAGAIGLFFALGEDAQWVSRYVINGQRVADDDLTPQELDIFVEEIVQTTKFPSVVNEVERRTGLVEEEHYEVTVSQAPASVALANVNVVSDTPDNARSVAVETSLIAIENTLEDARASLEATRDQLDRARRDADLRSAELVREAGGVNPTTAYNRAANQLLDRIAFLANPPTVTTIDDDGNTIIEPAPEPEPPMADLEAEVARLEPVDREYQQINAEINELTLKLSERNDSIREINGSIALLQTERENPFVLDEVVTEEASRISGLLTGLLLFAVPAALLTILAFVVFDLIWHKPEPVEEEFDPNAVLDAPSHRALPEANVTSLVVVDAEGRVNPDPPDRDVLAEDDGASSDDPDDDPTPKRGRTTRWGRDASSKAV